MLRRVAVDVAPVVERAEIGLGATRASCAHDARPPCFEELVDLVRCLERFDRAACRGRYEALKECLGYTDRQTE